MLGSLWTSLSLLLLVSLARLSLSALKESGQRDYFASEDAKEAFLTSLHAVQDL